MTEKLEDSLSGREEYLDHIFQVIRENEDFLRENSEELYSEIIGLMSDGIDLVRIAIGEGVGAEDYVKCSVLYFLNHVLMPVGGAIYVNALTGNLPPCFMELRLALESMVKCYLADLKYPGLGFFRDKLHLLEKDARKEHTSISKMMKEFDRHLKLRGDSIALWGKLSESWVHTRGIMDEIVDYVVEKSDIPPWGLVIPLSYTRDDLSSLDELRKRLAQFRHLLEVAMQEHEE